MQDTRAGHGRGPRLRSAAAFALALLLGGAPAHLFVRVSADNRFIL